MSANEFPLPDVGEGLTDAEIVQWKVQPGQTVAVNDVIVEIETAKSLVELPSPFAGVVDALLVQEGDTVEVGTPIIRVADAGEGAPEPAPSAATGQAAAEVAPEQTAVPPTEIVAAPESEEAAPEPAEEGSGAVLVGYGSAGHATSRRRGRPAASAPVTEPITRPASGPVLAKPPIRKLAKDLGVDLATVTASGGAGEVTRDDVVTASQRQSSTFRNTRTPDWPVERTERIPVKGVRKAIANAMVESAFTAPHVGVFVDVDATRTMEYVRRLKTTAEFEGIRISPLLMVAKAVTWAVRRNPRVNSSFNGDEIIVHNYVNLGIAATTPRGLIVPNVKDAHAMSLVELAGALQDLTAKSREGKVQPADMANGTITITNIGSFGMDFGTPILNPGEVAMIALGTIKQKPWVVDGQVVPRYVTTLGGSFDHRVVDGDVISRFIADVASVLEEPALLLD
ncbi:dihydrolipoamide acetyltransferase family protein [Arenivirga flava]|uniref:Dihydrolipoamide acetyltransferase component of pyruvate dehydrogenase complex n=1 Tax=Arenivirga flava TaxID=1930060 RepID=A0AA37UQP7_9MICO|nr:dihydrolipoamide acetyltransferase family protein [Arenivirga flava]GMA28986.1 dihydrolipoamide acetyltransferase component of pyruvate dehydrogenase complex [Arenivirga flava]